MKKLTALILILTLACSLFVGCNKDSADGIPAPMLTGTFPEPTVPTTPAPTTPAPTTPAPTTAAPVGNVYTNEQVDGRWKAGSINVLAKEVFYENGKLVAKCYLVNGFDAPAKNVCVPYLAITDATGAIIAEGDFNTEGQNWQLDPLSYEVITFTFSGNALQSMDGDLSLVNTSWRYYVGTKTYYYNDDITGRYASDCVTAVPVEVYLDGSDLVVCCRVVNGYNTTVTDVSAGYMTVRGADGTVIAQAEMSPQSIFLSANSWVVHTYRFHADTLTTTDLDLTQVTVEADYTQKVW